MKRVDGRLSGGLRLMWLGGCFNLAAAIVIVLSMTWAIFSSGAFEPLMLTVLAVTAGTAGDAVGVVGLFKLRGEQKAYIGALVVLALSFACTAIGKAVTEPLSTITGLVSSALGITMVYLVVHTTNTFLNAVGRDDLKAEGKKAFLVKVITFAVSLASGILTGLIASYEVRVYAHLLITGLAGIVFEVFFLTYLKHSSEALHKNTAKKERKR